MGGTIDCASAATSARPNRIELATLASFIDILLPRDTLSGSATDLGVDRQLWTFAKTLPEFRKLLDVGCRWLNMTGSVPFSDLSSAQQTAIVAWMSNADWNEVPRRFYELARQVTIELYYANPAAWKGLPITRSPQPLGYPPPWP